MRSRIAAWTFIIAGLVFLAAGAFSTPRRPSATVIGIALFVVGFAVRKRRPRNP